MSTIALQPTRTISRRYPTTEKKLQNSEKILSDREKSLQSIAFLTQYMEDLKAGRPVENIPLAPICNRCVVVRHN